MAGKLKISEDALTISESRLSEMAAQAAGLAEANRQLEDGELSSLRLRAAKLEDALKSRGGADDAERIARETAPKLPSSPGAAGPRALPAGGLSLSSLGIQIPGGHVATATVATPTKQATAGVSVARAPLKSLAESIVANAAANAVRLAGAPRAPPRSSAATEKVSLEVPEGAVPGSQLTVTAPSGQQVTMTVPEGAEPGQQLEVEVPAAATEETVTLEVPEGAVPGSQLTVTAPSGQQVTITVPEGAEVGSQLEVQVPMNAGDDSVVVPVPEGAVPGETLTVTAPSGQQVTMTVPVGAVAGQMVEVQLPKEAAPAETVLLEVPEGAVPGSQLTVTAPSGQQVTLTVPEGAVAGTQLEVEVPAMEVQEAIKESAIRALASQTEGLAIKLAQKEQASDQMASALAHQSLALEAAIAVGGEEAQSAAGGAAQQAASDSAAMTAAQVGPLPSTLVFVTRGMPSSPHIPWCHVACPPSPTSVMACPPHPTSLGATWQARVKELEARLEKGASELQAARSERLEIERMKMASEQICLDLKQEKLSLQDQVLEAEEKALIEAEESEEKDAQVRGALPIPSPGRTRARRAHQNRFHVITMP